MRAVRSQASRKSEQQLVAAKRASQAAKDELVELQGQYEHTEKQRRKLEGASRRRCAPCQSSDASNRPCRA